VLQTSRTMQHIDQPSPASGEELGLGQNRLLEVVMHWAEGLEEVELWGLFRGLILHRILEEDQDVKPIQEWDLVLLGNVLSISRQSQIRRA
jgi:hypothetical protein